MSDATYGLIVLGFIWGPIILCVLGAIIVEIIHAVRA